MVIFYRKTDEELFDLTQEDKNVALKLKEQYPKLRKVYIDIIKTIVENDSITQEEIAYKLNKTRNSIYRNIKTLKSMKILEIFGSKKNGYWKVNI